MYQHETSDKQFSSFYGNTTINGQEGENGASEKDQLIDMIVEHPECAKFICRKLHQFFIHSEITDETEVNFIEPLAELFRASDYEIKPVLKAMFTSAHFFSEQFRGAMIKSPADQLFGFWRAAGITLPEGGDPLDEEYYAHLSLYWRLQNMGYSLTDPPNVSGWPAYYQIPSFDKLWITTHTLIERIRVSDRFDFVGIMDPQSPGLLGLYQLHETVGRSCRSQRIGRRSHQVTLCKTGRRRTKVKSKGHFAFRTSH